VQSTTAGADATIGAGGTHPVSRPDCPAVRRPIEWSSPRAMAFALFYVVAIIILVLHFTGWLARNNLEWLVLVLAVAVFPAVLFL
jgi:hypothetical protein